MGIDLSNSLGRRTLLKALGSGGLAAAATSLASPAFARTHAIDPGNSSVAPRIVYVEDAGHEMAGAILDHWMQYGRRRVFGNPISRATTGDVPTTQFFERAVLTENEDSRLPTGVRPLDVGSLWLEENEDRIDVEQTITRYAFWFPQTGYGVLTEFWPKYLDEGGAFAWGYPITPGQVVNGQLTQTFERARFVMAEFGPSAVSLGRWMAERAGVDAQPMKNEMGVDPYRPSDFAPTYGPAEDRWADVNLTTQTTTFFDGDTPVYRALISSGVSAYFTTPGTWRIFRRVESEHMIGGSVEDGSAYNLRNVYFTQYFTRTWIGFHYAYWHDEFGTRQSHGCVNMNLDDSRWAWYFCDYDTRVVVHH